jgi:hypothetical protein
VDKSPKLNARQKKRLQAAQRLLGPQAHVMAYAAGRANARMTTIAWVIVGAFAIVALTLAALFGVILFPGLLLALFFYSSIRPFRGVAITTAGVVLMEVSLASGRPSRLLGTFPFVVLSPPCAQPLGNAICLQLGPDVVSLRRGEHLRLVSCLPPSPWIAPPGHPTPQAP